MKLADGLRGPPLLVGHPALPHHLHGKVTSLFTLVVVLWMHDSRRCRGAGRAHDHLQRLGLDAHLGGLVGHHHLGCTAFQLLTEVQVRRAVGADTLVHHVNLLLRVWSSRWLVQV